MKRKLLKKLLCVGLIGAMLVSSLGGCGSKGGDDGGNGGAAEPGASADNPDAGSEEQVTIRFYSTLGVSEPTYEPLQEILEKFEKDNPNIKVEQEVQSGTQYHEKLVSEIASDTLANVFMHWGGSEMIEAVQSGKMLDITELLDSDPEFKGQFPEVALYGSNNTYDDIEGVWGVPLTNVSAAFYYNKAFFAEAGIEKAPETWDELLEAIEKLKAIDVIPWAIGAKDGWRVEHLYSALFYRMNGIEGARKLADRSMKYSDPEAVAPWEMIKTLVDMDAFGPEPASVDASQEMAMVQTGKAAMTFSLSSFVENYTGADSEVGDDIEVFPMPVIKGYEQYANNNFAGGDIALGISTNATPEQIEASWKLCKAICGAEGQSLIATGNTVTTNNDITVDPEKVNRLMSTFVSIINDADAVTIDVTQYDSVATLLTKSRDVATALVNGQLTPQQAGEEMDAEIEMYSE